MTNLPGSPCHPSDTGDCANNICVNSVCRQSLTSKLAADYFSCSVSSQCENGCCSNGVCSPILKNCQSPTSTSSVVSSPPLASSSVSSRSSSTIIALISKPSPSQTTSTNLVLAFSVSLQTTVPDFSGSNPTTIPPVSITTSMFSVSSFSTRLVSNDGIVLNTGSAAVTPTSSYVSADPSPTPQLQSPQLLPPLNQEQPSTELSIGAIAGIGVAISVLLIVFLVMMLRIKRKFLQRNSAAARESECSELNFVFKTQSKLKPLVATIIGTSVDVPGETSAHVHEEAGTEVYSPTCTDDTAWSVPLKVTTFSLKNYSVEHSTSSSSLVNLTASASSTETPDYSFKTPMSEFAAVPFRNPIINSLINGSFRSSVGNRWTVGSSQTSISSTTASQSSDSPAFSYFRMMFSSN